MGDPTLNDERHVEALRKTEITRLQSRVQELEGLLKQTQIFQTYAGEAALKRTIQTALLSVESLTAPSIDDEGGKL